MRSRVENLRVKEGVRLPIPEVLERRLRVPRYIDDRIVSYRLRLARAIRCDAREPLKVIAGPCSVHNVQETIELGECIREMQRKYPNLDFLMRVCGEKPRTNGGCWKGLINDPNLDGSCDIEKGIRQVLHLMFELSKLGIPIATEFVDPDIATYIAGFVTFGWIGARSSADQKHRELGSGLSMPVGFKNGVDGGIDQAISAVRFAQKSNTFLGLSFETGRPAVIRTQGNPDGFVILRGGNKGGRSVPNYGPNIVRRVERQLPGMRLVIDCSHDNSHKKFVNQASVFERAVGYYKEGLPVFGVMLEMNLNPGKQTCEKGKALRYGVSITDECISVREGERLFSWANKKLAQTRSL